MKRRRDTEYALHRQVPAPDRGDETKVQRPPRRERSETPRLIQVEAHPDVMDAIVDRVSQQMEASSLVRALRRDIACLTRRVTAIERSRAPGGQAP